MNNPIANLGQFRFKPRGRPFGSKDKFPRANRKALSEAITLQKLVFEQARKGKGLASLVKAWDVLEDRKRVLRGMPTPGSLRPAEQKLKRKPVPFSVLRDDSNSESTLTNSDSSPVPPSPVPGPTSEQAQADSGTGPVPG